MKMKLWLCGQLRGKWSPTGSVWDFQGIFSDESKAVAACRNKNYFVYPVTLDEELPDERCLPPDAWYPYGELEVKEVKGAKVKPFMINDHGCAVFLPKKKRVKI